MRKEACDKAPSCHDSRECFAKTEMEDGRQRCSILVIEQTKTKKRKKQLYQDGKCPFCKPNKEITNGKEYPYVNRGK